MNALTWMDVKNLNTIIDSCGERVSYQWGDDVVHGTARHVVKDDETAGFMRDDEDIRDGLLRITTSTGWEHFIPMRTVMSMVRDFEYGVRPR